MSPAERSMGRALPGARNDEQNVSKDRVTMSKLLSPTAALAGVCAVALLGACAEPQTNEQEPSVEEAAFALSLPEPPQGSVCVTIERGVAGNVFDADLSSGNGSWAAGAYPGLWTGGQTSPHWMVVKPDLSPIPARAKIVQATFSVYAGWSATSSEVRAHRVTHAWSEATVNWPNFGGAASFDPATVGSFNPVGVGYRSIDVTGVVKDWYGGSEANNGLLLEENAGPTHSYNASESSSAAYRPRFDVCYLPNPCAGKEDGTACDDEQACTQGDTCQSEVCAGSPVVCAAADSCHDAGTCDPSTGVCDNPAKADGSSCDDGSACTAGESCLAGACAAGTEVECVAGTCDAATGLCPVFCPCRQLEDWRPLEDETSCTVVPGASAHLVGSAGEVYADSGTCATPTGSFSNMTPEEMAACLSDVLEFDTYSPTDSPAYLCGCQAGVDNIACNDGDPCTENDTCQAGACQSGAPKTCDAGEVCNAQTGKCEVPVPCNPSPCENGGTCYDNEGYSACICPAGYDGPYCEIAPDPCASNPCNSGICVATDSVNYTCTCGTGWTGEACDIPVCPCSAQDLNWPITLAAPGIEVIPESLHTLFDACNDGGQTSDFTAYRAFVAGVDASTVAQLQSDMAALDPADPGFCVAAHDLYFNFVSQGFVSAGSITFTEGGVPSTVSACMSVGTDSTQSSFFVLTPDQAALCAGEIDAAGGGNVTTM